MPLSGQNVMITGANRGIGAAAVDAFVAAGARVAMIARHIETLDALQALHGDRVLALAADVGSATQIAEAVMTAEDALGPLDVLVSNAGTIAPIGPLAETDPDAWSRAIDVNLKGVYNGLRAVLPGMLARGKGTVISLSSGAAHAPYDAWSAYCASKAGAFMLTRQVHLEYRERGIRSLGLSPGTVATDMQLRIRESGQGPVAKLEWADHIPAAWPARALVWMCSDASDPWLGDDVRLRDPDIRAALGLA